MPAKIQVLGSVRPEFQDILDPGALSFVADLAREFEPTRQELMKARVHRQAEINQGRTPEFLSETRRLRESDWRVPPAPEDLRNRRVEITGPSSSRRMVINALNSGAQVYMTDFEDAHSPGWSQTLAGQVNVRDAVRRTISDTNPDGRQYQLNEETATLCVRPRGLHLLERHVLVDGQPVAGSFFDFGLTIFHNARTQLEQDTGPYFYLPKLESHKEVRLWNSVFNFAEDRLNIPRGVISPTVLIEHILAAFEMEEILYELRERPSGLNLGRWDYIFSYIKTFSQRSDAVFPDRAQVTMATHFLRSAAELLVNICHRRGAHALGGMSAYIPRRDDPEANEKALTQVRVDKEREASQGFDGAWVAHPGLVPPVLEVFQSGFTGDNQLSRIPEVKVSAADLLQVPKGEITEAGLRNNISVALQYIDAWIQGNGAVAIYGLMEDSATAEISRSQLWQWVRHGANLSDGRQITAALYQEIRADEVDKLLKTRGPAEVGALDKAVELLDELVTTPSFTEFLTVPGYRYLE
jgi:malate synthase